MNTLLMNKPSSRSRLLANFIWIIALTCLSLLGCKREVEPLSLSDSRLPAEAKQRIADAEDAVIISQSLFEDAQAILAKAQERQAHFNAKPPRIGSALGAAQAVMDERVNLRTQQLAYAQAERSLSHARLKLIYAQTAMRYDLKVYHLTSITKEVKQKQAKMLNQRKRLKTARQAWESKLSEWWVAYKNLAKTSGTHPFWVYEFTR